MLSPNSNNRPLVLEVNPAEELSEENMRFIIMEFRDIVSLNFGKYLAKIYGTTFAQDKKGFFIAFPQIIINDNPLYKNLERNLRSIVNRSLRHPERITFHLQEYVFPMYDFDPRNGFSCPDLESMSEFDIDAAKQGCVTENSIALTVERFDFVLDLINHLNETDMGVGSYLFKTNLVIFASAYKAKRGDELQSRNEERYVEVREWLEMSRRYNIAEHDAENAFEEADDYAYTVITLEEILKRYSRELKTRIEKYNRDRFLFMIKALFMKKDRPSDRDLFKVFAEKLREKYFYTNGKIYAFEGDVCHPYNPEDLSPLIDAFIAEVDGIRGFLVLEAKNSGVTDSYKIFDERFSQIVYPFSREQSAKFAEKACATYLRSRGIKKGTNKNCIAFKDFCTVYSIRDGKKYLERRKAFMEDHFFKCASYKLNDFGKRDVEIKAIHEVYECFEKMFTSPHEPESFKNVDWFIRWLGSLFVRNPERCVLYLYGPSGKNAKSSLMKALAQALGPYGKPFKDNMFLAVTKGGVTCEPFWAEAEDVVIGIVPETPIELKYSSVIVKEASGADIKITAQKNEKPKEYVHTAKLVFIGNGYAQFDNPDKALFSRLYPIFCHGIFDPEASKDPEIQRMTCTYPDDADFWTTLRKRALLYIALTDGFQRYAEFGLKRTPYQEKHLQEWKEIISPYAKFDKELIEGSIGEERRTPAKELFNIFMSCNPKSAQTLTYETFVSEFKQYTGKEPHEFENQQWYMCYHPTKSRTIKRVNEGMNPLYPSFTYNPRGDRNSPDEE
jgi:hypothetical protein